MNMEGKVAGPAIGLIVIGVLGVLLTIPSFVMAFIDPAIFEQLFERLRELAPPEAREQLDPETFVAATRDRVGLAWTAVLAGLNVFIAWAGVRMLSLKSWTAAIVASSLMMVTCCVQCCCCPIGVGIGIWSLIVLLDPNVKQAFEAKAAA